MNPKSLGVSIALALLGPWATAQSNGIPGQIQQLQQQLAQTQAQVTALSSQVSALQNSLAAQGSQMWVVADCNNGGSINAALQSASGHAGPLGIFVLGVCHESVGTDRSNTFIFGGTPDAGISPPPSSNENGLSINDAVNFTVANMSFSGASGSAAISVWQSDANFNNLTITNNNADGILASHAKVQVDNSTISNNASWGIFEIDGSAIDLNNCTLEHDGNAPIQVWASHIEVNGGSIQNNDNGIQIVGGASMDLNQGALIANNGNTGLLVMANSTVVIGRATIQSNSGSGIAAQEGSSIVMGWAGNPVTIQNNAGGGIYLWDTSTAFANTADAAEIEQNPGGGIICISANGAPAAQIGGWSSGFVLSGNGSAEISCPTNFNH